jgi:alpha,alpha-trehalase
MAGTPDLLQRCYTGLELRHGEICFNPALPPELSRLSFRLRYCRYSLHVDLGEGLLSIASDSAAPSPINVRVKTDARCPRPGERPQFRL